LMRSTQFVRTCRECALIARVPDASPQGNRIDRGGFLR
jgi:hypothetical protein